MFAAQGGIKAVAAQSKVEIQAQSDALDILAKIGIIISSTEDRIEISSPKEIVITGATSQITLNGSGIFPKTGGEFESECEHSMCSKVGRQRVLNRVYHHHRSVVRVSLNYYMTMLMAILLKGGYTVTDSLGKQISKGNWMIKVLSVFQD